MNSVSEAFDGRPWEAVVLPNVTARAARREGILTANHVQAAEELPTYETWKRPFGEFLVPAAPNAAFTAGYFVEGTNP